MSSGFGPKTKNQLRTSRADQIDKKWVREPLALCPQSSPRTPLLEPRLCRCRPSFQVALTPLSPFSFPSHIPKFFWPAAPPLTGACLPHRKPGPRISLGKSFLQRPPRFSLQGWEIPRVAPVYKLLFESCCFRTAQIQNLQSNLNPQMI